MKDVYTIEDLRDWRTATADCDPQLRLAVIGDPVAHSASPQMHNAALAALGIPARYTRLHIKPAELTEALGLLHGAGFIGINCTIPHKPGVLDAVDTADEGAKRAGGVNTVLVGPDGKLSGFSTDGPGFSRGIRECFGTDLRDLRVLVLGAGGGAGRAIAMQCAAEQCRALTLLTRSLDKLAPLPAKYLTAAHLIYDTVYIGHRTPLLTAADTVGARGANGLSMLLHQGALSFKIWFQREAPIDEMRNALLTRADQ